MTGLDELVNRVISKAGLDTNRTPKNKSESRFVLAIGGPPGAGKTTTATALTQELQKLGFKAISVPMDGFHYTRAELDKFDDPDKAHKFRGAPFTFDLPKVKAFAAKLHTREPLKFPGFDHALKDPSPDAGVIDPEVEIVIFEGNYLLLNIDGWQDLAQFWDYRLLLTEETETLQKRLAARHLAAGLVETEEAGIDRANFNDIPNGELVMKYSVADEKF